MDRFTPFFSRSSVREYINEIYFFLITRFFDNYFSYIIIKYFITNEHMVLLSQKIHMVKIMDLERIKSFSSRDGSSK